MTRAIVQLASRTRPSEFWNRRRLTLTHDPEQRLIACACFFGSAVSLFADASATQSWEDVTVIGWLLGARTWRLMSLRPRIRRRGAGAALLDTSAARFATAARLGTLAAEIESESDQQQLRVADSLLVARSRLAFVMRFVLFLMIGLLLMAMYVPIFTLGSAI